MPKHLETSDRPVELFHHTLETTNLKPRGQNTFDLRPNATEAALIAAQIGVVELRKLRFGGTITALGKSDWQLKAQLGATVVQSCVISLKPVVTRVDIVVKRVFVSQKTGKDISNETEFDGDDTMERLTPEMDLGQILAETLVLEIPAYPKAPEASLETKGFTAPGLTPMSDEDVKPFASLAALKAKMQE